MRHAKSSWDDLNINDFDRPLSKRGKKNAKMICEFFVKKKFKFDYALISSSKRTKKTFQILSKKINKPKKFERWIETPFNSQNNKCNCHCKCRLHSRMLCRSFKS